MAYTTIDDPSAYFHIQTWTGNGVDDRNITNDALGDFQPDYITIKKLDDGSGGGAGWTVQDSTRGVAKCLEGDTDIREQDFGVSGADRVQAFQSDGFQLGANSNVNENNSTFEAFQWKMNGGTTTAGGGDDTIATSTHQANTTAKQSIVTYTGESSSKTVAHGLGVVPDLIIVKKREDDAQSWRVFHQFGYKGGGYGQWQSGGRQDVNNAFDHGANSYWDNTAATSTVFTVKDNATVNANGDTFVAYCWAEVQGYSSFGSHKGNGLADGPFVYTGFRPKYVVIKETTNANEWRCYDSERVNITQVGTTALGNPQNQLIYLDDDQDQSNTGHPLDFLSNGFKIRGTTTDINRAAGNYIHIAFAEFPFVTSTGIPCPAL